jgi:glyoxylase I family protein
MITGLEHTAIACSDPKALSSWYLKYLGFSPLLDTGNTIYIRSANGVVLEFVFADTHPPAPLIRDAGLRHIAFTADDLNSARDELQASGVEFVEERLLLGMRLLFFRDPEGNFLHLVQREIPLLR